MPPRLEELFSALRLRAPASPQPCNLRPLPASIPRFASTVAQKRRRQDPYALAQARARKAANVSRQEVLRTERAKAYGDPIRGLTTPFVQSFDTAQPIPSEFQKRDAEGQSTKDTREKPSVTSPSQHHLNHYVTQEELAKSLEHSRLMTEPTLSASPGSEDPREREENERAHREGHEIASEALSRIVDLENSSSADRRRINIQRCIDTFGRHNTDTYLRRKPQSNVPRYEDYVPNDKTPRAGPDTGSSEVQIAILTAKIRTLSQFIAGRGRKDKANTRNLRLLVHRRQKMLQYMRRRERGGERWQNLVQTLGLTEGTWKGEIVV